MNLRDLSRSIFLGTCARCGMKTRWTLCAICERDLAIYDERHPESGAVAPSAVLACLPEGPAPDSFGDCDACGQWGRLLTRSFYGIEGDFCLPCLGRSSCASE